MDISTEIVHTNQPIPFRLVVGVTGHRKLPDDEAAARAVHSVLEQIKERLPHAPKTSVFFTVLSPLAEGADRLVAREVLTLDNSQLEAVLPFDKDEYVKDFPETKAEFESLLQRSKRVKQLGGKNAREHTYTTVGRYVVDHCDVLIALWNGQPAAGKGGTAEIVQYARDTKCPLFWINTQDPAQPVVFENGEHLPVRIVEDLNEYNSDQIDESVIGASVLAEYDKLISQAQNAERGTQKLLDGYDVELREVYKKVLPQYVRADWLAKKYQRKYYLAGVSIYSLAAAAVAVAAIQILESVWWGIPIVEVLLMVGVLAIIWREGRYKWHHKYIYYRSLAERFRTELFMSFGNVEGGLSAPRRRSHSSPSDWITAAFTSIWSELPQFRQPNAEEFDALKKFLCSSWIQDQIDYHDTKYKEARKWNIWLINIGTALFVITLLAAMLHLLGNYGNKDHAAPPCGDVAAHGGTVASHGEAAASQTGGTHEAGKPGSLLHTLHEFGDWLILIALVAPAVGSALAAIRTHREYHRIATRHKETSRQLKILDERIFNAQNFTALLPLMRETEETMLRENEDWRAVVESREIEIP